MVADINGVYQIYNTMLKQIQLHGLLMDSNIKLVKSRSLNWLCDFNNNTYTPNIYPACHLPCFQHL